MLRRPRRNYSLLVLSLVFGLVTACSDDSATGDPVCGDGVVEGTEQCDGDDLGDLGCTDLSDLFEGGQLTCSASCMYDTSECELVAAAPLQAGVARVRMPVPLGIGTVGFAAFNVEAEPSPFAEIYAATNKIHGHPEFKAVVISRGPGFEVVFLRSDTVGVFQQFRLAVAREVEARLGRPFDDSLIMGGTHTHSGPGRVVDGGNMYDIIADEFFPEFYVNMVDSAATAVMMAFDDLAPARVGHAWAENGEAHEDRRCDDGMDYTNDAIPVIVVEREGQIDGVVFSYAVHGTVLGAEETTLSRDVAGGIEEFVEAGFDHPVVAVFFNSWGADMRPTRPTVPTQTAAQLPDGYQQLLQVGRSVADSIHAEMTNVVYEQDPEIFSEVHRVKLDRQAIGYAEEEFEYEWGGVYCGGTETKDCDPETTEFPWNDDICLPFPEQFPAPNQTVLSAGRIGSLYFVTFPGEPGTLLAEELIRRINENLGYENIAFFGYTQDYNGYSILEDDWWQGGYEAGGSIWGPRQGEYLVDMAEATFARTLDNGPYKTVDASAPGPIALFDVPPERYEPYVPTPPVDVGTITMDATATMYDATDIVVVTVLGSDPWLGAPLATLVDGAGDPVLGANGKRITSDGYAFWLQLDVAPLYSEEMFPTQRSFYWTISMPIRQPVLGLVPDLGGGTYRLRITIPTNTDPVEVDTSVFAVQ